MEEFALCQRDMQSMHVMRSSAQLIHFRYAAFYMYRAATIYIRKVRLRGGPFNQNSVSLISAG